MNNKDLDQILNMSRREVNTFLKKNIATVNLDLASDTLRNLDLLYAGSQSIVKEIQDIEKKAFKTQSDDTLIFLVEAYITKLKTLGTLVYNQVASYLGHGYDSQQFKGRISAQRLQKENPELFKLLFNGMEYFDDVTQLRNLSSHNTLASKVQSKTTTKISERKQRKSKSARLEKPNDLDVQLIRYTKDNPDTTRGHSLSYLKSLLGDLGYLSHGLKSLPSPSTPPGHTQNKSKPYITGTQFDDMFHVEVGREMTIKVRGSDVKLRDFLQIVTGEYLNLVTRVYKELNKL